MLRRPPEQLDSLELLDLVCQLHTRSLTIHNKGLHDIYVNARKELERRIIENCHVKTTVTACNCGKYHSKKSLIRNICDHCGKKIIIN